MHPTHVVSLCRPSRLSHPAGLPPRPPHQEQAYKKLRQHFQQQGGGASHPRCHHLSGPNAAIDFRLSRHYQRAGTCRFPWWLLWGPRGPIGHTGSAHPRPLPHAVPRHSRTAESGRRDTSVPRCHRQNRLGSASVRRELGIDEERVPRCVLLVQVQGHHAQLKQSTAYTTDSGYTSDEQYFADLIAAYRAGLKYLCEAGCRNVQFDGPNKTFFVMDEFLQGLRLDGSTRLT